MSDRRFLVPKGTEMMRDQYHFSQGVQVGNTIYVSGQGGWNADFSIADTLAAQARQAFRNMATVLKEGGASLDDVVEITSYHLDMDQMGAVVEAMREAFPEPSTGVDGRRCDAAGAAADARRDQGDGGASKIVTRAS